MEFSKIMKRVGRIAFITILDRWGGPVKLRRFMSNNEHRDSSPILAFIPHLLHVELPLEESRSPKTYLLSFEIVRI